MDIPFGTWLPELDLEDTRELMYQLQQTPSYNELTDSFSLPNFKGYHQNLVTRDHSVGASTISRDLDKQASHNTTTTTTSSFAPNGVSSSSTFTISFGDFTSPAYTPLNQTQLNGGHKLEYHDSIKRVSSARRNRRQAQEHILAERKRREKLTQRFISLSNLLPEIKKMDKATVLEDASKYIKHLQNRVKELEETSIGGENIIHESIASMRQTKFRGGHELDASSFDETSSIPCNTSYNPGIKVRILENNVLVRIYSHRNSPIALNALTEMEKLHFTIMCNSVLPVSDTDALITIIAQMSEEFVITAKDLVQCLRLSLSMYR